MHTHGVPDDADVVAVLAELVIKVALVEAADVEDGATVVEAAAVEDGAMVVEARVCV